MQYWERRRRSYWENGCRRLLRRIEEPTSEIVVVLDNAPVHVILWSVSQEEEFQGVELLSLALHNAPLNPIIEECWSVFKSEFKVHHKNSQPALSSNPPHEGTTQTEHRLQYLERIIDISMPKITPMLCMKDCNHVQRHFQRCFNMMNLNMWHNLLIIVSYVSVFYFILFSSVLFLIIMHMYYLYIIICKRVHIISYIHDF